MVDADKQNTSVAADGARETQTKVKGGPTLTASSVGLVFAVLVVITLGFFIPRQLYFAFDINRARIVELRAALVSLTELLANLQDKELTFERDQKDFQTSLKSTEEELLQFFGQLPSRIKFPLANSGALMGPRDSESNLAQLQMKVSSLYRINEALESNFRIAEGFIFDVAKFADDASILRKKRQTIMQSLTQATLNLAQTNNKIVAAREDLKRLSRQLMELSKESETLYHVVRAFALGALGAFGAAAAQRTGAEGAKVRLYASWTVLSMFFGGLVSLAVFGLFTTREISVFSGNVVAPDQVPDYWRTLILCLAAGAFADRLFSAARQRVDGITNS